MYRDITKEKIIVITVITALLLIFSFLAGLAYGYLLKPRFGERYANIFFMVSFTIIFFSLIYIYHIWIGRIQEREDWTGFFFHILRFNNMAIITTIIIITTIHRIKGKAHKNPKNPLSSPSSPLPSMTLPVCPGCQGISDT